MGFFDKATEALQKATAIGVKFEDLERTVERLAERQIYLAERIAKLEERLSTVKDNATTEARSAAHVGVYKLQSEVTERLTRLEEQTGRLRSETDHRKLDK